MKNRLVEILNNDSVVKSIKENLDDVLSLIPELKDMIGFEHKHPHHHLDVWNHTLLALSIAPEDIDVRLVLLLHDIGKPHSYQDEEVRHFRGHADVSSKMAFLILERLGFEEDKLFELSYLIEMHDTPITDEEITHNSELMKKRFLIQVCDGLAHHPDKIEKRIKYLLRINSKLNNVVDMDKFQKMIYRNVKK